jgi:hypothetical protein
MSVLTGLSASKHSLGASGLRRSGSSPRFAADPSPLDPEGGIAGLGLAVTNPLGSLCQN